MPLARAPGDVEHLLAVENALDLGDRRLQQLRGHRADEAPLHSGRLFDREERLRVLRHRTLPAHLPGRDEVVSELAHHRARAADHRRVAVDARIHRAAESVRRILYERHLLVREVHHVQLHPERLRRPFRRIRLEERRLERNPLHVRARALQHLYRQLAIQPPAHEGQSPGPAFLRHLSFLTFLLHLPARTPRVTPPKPSPRCERTASRPSRRSPHLSRPHSPASPPRRRRTSSRRRLRPSAGVSSRP